MQLTAVATGLVVIAVSAVGAQQPPTRVRITGPQTLNLPGQLTIDRDRFNGAGLIDMNDDVIRVKTPDGNGVWTVPRSGKRLIGTALGIDGNVVQLRRDGDTTSLFVPLPAIETVEISEGRRPNHGIALGILTGVGTFYGILGISFANCGLGCPDTVGVLAIGAGIAAGAGLAHHLRREHWRTVPVGRWAVGLTKPTP